MLARAWAWTAADTVVHALPLFHVHGLNRLVRCAPPWRRASLGAAVLPEDVGAVLRDHDPAILFAVPTMYHRLCEAAVLPWPPRSVACASW